LTRNAAFISLSRVAGVEGEAAPTEVAGGIDSVGEGELADGFSEAHPLLSRDAMTTTTARDGFSSEFTVASNQMDRVEPKRRSTRDQALTAPAHAEPSAFEEAWNSFTHIS
jgi:hypothetical protein